jgi:CRP/FNR family transcriptional regulator, anaerobic regulatory protein
MTMSAITRDRFLDIFPVFQKGPQALVNDILSFSQYMAMPPNTILQREGEYSPGLVLVISGEKRIYKQSGNSKEITLYNVVAGEFCIINAMSLLSNSPYPANAVSVTKVELLIIPPDKFKEYIFKYEEMRNLIFSFISKNLADVMELVAEVAFKRMDERLMDYIIEKSEDDRLPATHQTIANELGTAREVVSRLLKDFERRGLVILSRNCIQLTNLKLS